MNTLGASELAALAEIARDAAREAAAVVAKGWRQHPNAEHKGRVDLVTSFDRASEELLRDRLGRATSFAFVGEEGGGMQSTSEPTWYVDPLDGTTNFVHGHPFYCVSVGLAAAGAPLAGAVVAPALGVEWVGTRDSATRNGAPCRVSETATLDDALLATGFPYDRAHADDVFEAFVNIKKRARGVRRCGAAAIDLCLVADGTYDGYWERSVRSWDLTAGAALVLGAGGRTTKYDGGGGDVRSGEMVATNGRIHDVLLACLAEVRWGRG